MKDEIKVKDIVEKINSHVSVLKRSDPIRADNSTSQPKLSDNSLANCKRLHTKLEFSITIPNGVGWRERTYE